MAIAPGAGKAIPPFRGDDWVGFVCPHVHKKLFRAACRSLHLVWFIHWTFVGSEKRAQWIRLQATIAVRPAFEDVPG